MPTPRVYKRGNRRGGIMVSEGPGRSRLPFWRVARKNGCTNNRNVL
jgi:hypothetical protein